MTWLFKALSMKLYSLNNSSYLLCSSFAYVRKVVTIQKYHWTIENFTIGSSPRLDLMMHRRLFYCYALLQHTLYYQVLLIGESLHIGSWWSRCWPDRHTCLARTTSVTDGESTVRTLLYRGLLVDRLLHTMLNVVIVLHDGSEGICSTSSAYIFSIPPYLQTLLCVFCSSSFADVVKPQLDLFAALPLVLRISKLFYSFYPYQHEKVLQCCLHKGVRATPICGPECLRAKMEREDPLLHTYSYIFAFSDCKLACREHSLS